MKRILSVLFVFGMLCLFQNAFAQKVIDTVYTCCQPEKEYVVTDFDNWMRTDWAFSMSGGSNLFYGDLRVYDYWPVKENHNERSAAFNFGLEKQLNDFVTLRGNFLHGNLSGTKREFANGNPANMFFDAKVNEYSTVFEFNLSNIVNNLQELNKDKRVTMSAYLGAGVVNFRTERRDLKTNDVIQGYGYNGNKLVSPTREMVFPVGLGLDLRATKALSLNLDVSLRIVNSDKLDGYVANYNNKTFQDMYGYTALGFTYKFGLKDCDKDGVVNRLDKCPDTPYGMPVDKNGCITDKDGDGVVDTDDACPDVFGSSVTKGCPDTDGDGIADKDDTCPQDKGLAVFNGCPDTDGDMVPDYQDKCPKEKGVIALSGCPDADGDSIPDYEDRCPQFAGTKALNGCPDKDKDGIADVDDKCPDVFGLAKNLGCPEVKKEVLRIFEKALTGIQFETGKDVIKKTSFPILDQVVKAMKENPTYNLEINGHTDNVGDPAKNMVLSDKRAAAVKKYLVSKGIDENRMITKGFGDTIPVADNKTTAGKAKNRRVEFKVIFQTIEFE